MPKNQPSAMVPQRRVGPIAARRRQRKGRRMVPMQPRPRPQDSGSGSGKAVSMGRRRTVRRRTKAFHKSPQWLVIPDAALGLRAAARSPLRRQAGSISSPRGSQPDMGAFLTRVRNGRAFRFAVCCHHRVLFTNSIVPLFVSMVPTILSPFTVRSHLLKAAVRPG
jgi:hypothetical protein